MSSTIELLPQPLFTGRIDTQSPETIITSSPRTSSSAELIRIVSPRSSKSSNVGGIGLGMVVALDKFGSGTDIAKNPSVSTNSNRSNPIPIGSSKSYMSMKGRSRASCIDNEQESSDLGCLDNCVTATATTTTTTTTTSTSRVLLYCDDDHEDDFFRREVRNRLRKMGVFDESPPRSYNDTRRTAAVAAFPPLDFLSSCNLCRKKLHGRDIYMYRGEKAFCSTDCRCRQIIIDEHKEKYCVNEVVVSRSADISGSPAYLEDQIFSTGIMAI